MSSRAFTESVVEQATLARRDLETVRIPPFFPNLCPLYSLRSFAANGFAWPFTERGQGVR